MEVRPGMLLAGKYRVDRTVGEGGMGVVVSATHTQLGQRVAVKYLHDEALRSPEKRARLLREARAASKLRSKHAAKVLDVGTFDDGAPYIVMELLEGIDLSHLLAERGKIPAYEAVEYVLQACEAIAEAHGIGIVHRDLKPANLFLTRDAAGRPVIKVLDFGVSKLRKVPTISQSDATIPGGRAPRPEESVVTHITDVLGSPGYMAPEQLLSSRDADVRSDVFSMGVILFRLTSGRPPMIAPTIQEYMKLVLDETMPSLRDHVADLPEGLEGVVARALARKPNDRFQTVAEFAAALAPYAPSTATPSLERIALLGPNLVRANTQPPPPPRASTPSVSDPSTDRTDRADRAAPFVSRFPSNAGPYPPTPDRRVLYFGLALFGVLFVIGGAVISRSRAERESIELGEGDVPAALPAATSLPAASSERAPPTTPAVGVTPPPAAAELTTLELPASPNDGKAVTKKLPAHVAHPQPTPKQTASPRTVPTTRD